MKAVGTIPSLKRRVLPILKRHSIKRASIFGSFARGDAKSNSDVDFLIEYKNTKSKNALIPNGIQRIRHCTSPGVRPGALNYVLIVPSTPVTLISTICDVNLIPLGGRVGWDFPYN